jgi:hypothetical protein
MSAACQNGFQLQITGLGPCLATKTIQVTEVALQATPGVATGLNSAPPAADFRHYGDELFYAQRFYCVIPTSPYGFPCPSSGGYAMYQQYRFPRTMRAAPTLLTGGHTSLGNVASVNLQATNTDYLQAQIVGSTATNTTWNFGATFSAEI